MQMEGKFSIVIHIHVCSSLESLQCMHLCNQLNGTYYSIIFMLIVSNYQCSSGILWVLKYASIGLHIHCMCMNYLSNFILVFFLWKMKVRNRNKFKKSFRKLISYLITGSCLGLVIWQTIQCMTKYIQKSQGTTVSMKKSANLSFPAITVCGSFGKDSDGNDMGLNETYLQNVCGIR